MAYRVDYGPVKKVRGGERTRVPGLTALFLLVFFLMVGLCWPRGVQILRDMLIPGDPAVMVAAMDNFARDLEQGTELADAFENFCVFVVRGVQGAPG